MRVYYCDENDWFCDEQDVREKLWKEANDKLKKTLRQIVLERERKNKISKEEIEKQEVINDVLDRFDFDSVEEVMYMTGWVWGNGRTEHIPTQCEMRKFSRKLLEEAIDKENAVSNGGFRASSWKEDDGQLRAKLEFVFSQTETYLK